MYKKIVVAVDGSKSSDRALEQAIGVARTCDAEVLAVFVVDNTDVYFDGGYYDPAAMLAAIHDYGSVTLERAAQRLAEAGIPHRGKLVERPIAPGRIADTIVAEADACDADLIVLGTHGRRGVRRLVMGSVAEGVLRHTTRPVLLIRSEQEA